MTWPVSIRAGKRRWMGNRPAGGRTRTETHMKYALLIYSTPGAADEARAAGQAPAGSGPAADGVIDDWVEYTRVLKDAGAVLGAEQLHPVDSATTVRLRDGDRLLTDGPFIETKEHLLGFYLLDVPDLDAAIEWAARMPLIRYGSVEVRPVAEGGQWRAVLD
jgi:hypothetical protein